MPIGRTVSGVLLVCVLGVPLAGCSEAGVRNALTQLAALAAAFEKQAEREFRDDPLNDEWAWDKLNREGLERNFNEAWPSSVPTPSGRTPEYYVGPYKGGMAGDWKISSEDAARYPERLADAGWEQTSEGTETDPATGWQKTTTTYRDDSGQTVAVVSTDNSSGFTSVWVDVNPPGDYSAK